MSKWMKQNFWVINKSLNFLPVKYYYFLLLFCWKITIVGVLLIIFIINNFIYYD